MHPTDEIKRAEDAKLVLENPMFKDAISSVRDGLITAMNNSPMGDDKSHNRLVIALQLLNQIEKNLVTHINTGKLATIQIKEKQGLMRFLK